MRIAQGQEGHVEGEAFPLRVLKLITSAAALRDAGTMCIGITWASR